MRLAILKSGKMSKKLNLRRILLTPGKDHPEIPLGQRTRVPPRILTTVAIQSPEMYKRRTNATVTEARLKVRMRTEVTTKVMKNAKSTLLQLIAGLARLILEMLSRNSALLLTSN